MARTYKNLEKSLVHTVMNKLRKIYHIAGRGIRGVFKLFDRKLTVMIVPHSQSNVINFRTNIFSLVTGIVIVLGVLTSFFYFNEQSDTSASEISRLRNENTKTLASFDELRDENNNLLQAAEQFQSTLNESLALVGISLPSSQQSSNQDSDLSSLFNMQEVAQGSVRETTDVRQLTSYIEGAVQPIEEIGNMLERQRSMFSNTPNLWPLKGGIGRITLQFGRAIHPLTGQWYIHKGLDIATGRSGDAIIATANGQVVTIAFDQAFGNYVIVRHKHGYLTRYAHLQTSYVSVGQYVSQGEVIAAVGNTGLSTAAHLHYEVHVGSEVVDPEKYVNIKSSN